MSEIMEEAIMPKRRRKNKPAPPTEVLDRLRQDNAELHTENEKLRTMTGRKPRSATRKRTRDWDNTPQNRIIPPEVVRYWRTDVMGWSERDAAEKLGMSRGFLRSCENEGAPLYVGLALAALRSGLPPFDKDASDE